MARRLAGLLLAAALGVSGLMALAPIGPSAAAAPSGPTWTQVADLPTGCGGSTPCTSSPPGGAGASMAYDPATNQLVLFGSNGNSTWVWSGTTWTPSSCADPDGR